jgi:hypothetical protein
MDREKDSGCWVARLAIWTVALLVMSCAIGAAVSSAALPLERFDFEFSANEPGGHPDLEMDFAVSPDAAETLKSFTVLPPAGFAIEPSAIPSCTGTAFALNQCPPAAQFGLATVRGKHEGNGEFVFGTVPVYQLTRGPNQFMSFGFTVPVLNLPLKGQALLPRSDDYRLHLGLDQLPQDPPLTGLKISIWGVPADVAHDQSRFPQGSSGCVESENTSCNTATASSLPQLPLTLDAVYCPASWTRDVSFTSHQDPSHAQSSSGFVTDNGERCDTLGFSPTLTLTPTTAAGYSPTGLDLEVKDPQPQLPDALSPSELRTAIVTMQGLTIGPSLNGHPVCTDADAAMSADAPSSCPQASALGTAQIEVEGISDPLPGKVFLAGPGVNGAPRLFLVATGGGLELKLQGTLEDLGAGKLRFTFAGLPRLPIVAMRLHIDGGQALLRTPVHCGVYAIGSELVSWNPLMTPQKPTSTFTISSGPGGAPCIGGPTRVAVHLDPASIAADGLSQVTATVEVLDANGSGVPAEEVRLTSSDPLQHIGEVVDKGDGTYSAVITGSSTMGTATITATVLSPTPDLIASATLLQTGAAPTPPAPVPPAPPPTAKPLCTVPNLHGRRLKAAGKRITGAGCALGRVKKRHGVTNKSGKVVGQRPKAGIQLPAWAPVKVTLG